jgi:acyl-CoA oxidase
MNLDRFMSAGAIEKRKATAEVMERIRPRLNKHVEETSFPHWIIDELRPLKINGLDMVGYGSPGLATIEAGSICYELAKVDTSVSTFVLVHNGLGMAVIAALGDEEQKQRLLPAGVNFDKIFCFGLTEPQNGSDASNLKATARKVEGGYILNG